MLLCGYVEPRLRALADGELPPGESRRVLRHLEQCGRCHDAYARVRMISSLLHEQELEEPPAHFTANLQLRLARHRRDAAPVRRRFPAFSRPLFGTRSATWISGLSSAAIVAGAVVALTLSSRGINASEVARRAEATWQRTQNYSCVFESRGVYQGQPRTFTQRQFFRRPGDFHLDTAQDYPLTTFVSRDRVVHYLPGGDWKHRGPLVIIRPRSEGQNALPFPFGVTWGNGGNVSLDQLVRQLGRSNTQLLGEETTDGRAAYHLQFMQPHPAGPNPDRYDLWIDKESFLPRRVSWYRDADNHIDTEAKDLQTNIGVLPAGTFEFQMPRRAFVIHGDVDPHVLALPFLPERTSAYSVQPVAAAEEEIAARAGSVPFPVLAPHWLPEGYELVRVRRKAGRWLDVHWMRATGPDGGRMLKLAQQPAESGSSGLTPAGEEISLPSAVGPVAARLIRGSAPYEHVILTWQQGATRCTLSAAELPVAEVLRIAGSVSRAVAPAPGPAVVEADRHAVESRGEPSLIPTEAEPARENEPGSASGSAQEQSPAAVDLSPMMPEMPDDERAKPARVEGGG